MSLTYDLRLSHHKTFSGSGRVALHVEGHFSKHRPRITASWTWLQGEINDCAITAPRRDLARRRTAPIVSAQETGTNEGGSQSLFIFGFGYSALGLATQLAKKGWSVRGTCRSLEKQTSLQKQGFDAFIFDTDQMTLGLGKKGIAALQEATHLLVTISPQPATELCPVMWLLGQNFKAVSQQLQWVGYLSSTSVYGDYGGDWVTEESDLRAEAGNGLARRKSESSWLSFGAATGLPVHTFRLAGIYGPDRSALDITTRGGKRSGKQYTSRCHVHDICQVLMASMASPQPGAIYNIADDDPVSRDSVIDYVQAHYHVQAKMAIREEQSGNGVAAVMGDRSEKRVCNKKIKEELGVKLMFPSFKEGLAAIHEGNRTPFA